MTIDQLLKDNRIGRVEFSKDFMRTLQWEELKVFTSKIFILETQSSFVSNSIIMHCVSPEFRSLNEGEVAPFYGINVKVTMDEETNKPIYEVDLKEIKNEGRNY